MSASISVVIPNYNGKELLKKNIPTVIRALKYVQADYEMIVSDDNSKDDSVAYLKSHYPEIILITNSENLGFSGNINRGLRAAKKNLVFILNSDVSLNEDYFEHKLSYFDDLAVFGVMGALYDEESGQLLKTDLKPEINFWGIVSSKPLLGYDYSYSVPMIFISGANTLVRNSMLKELDYFCELFSPYYGEDIDLGLRAARKGWKIFYEPKSKCFHQVSSTIKKHSTRNKVKIISKRNKFIFHTLHLEGFNLLLFGFKFLFDFLLRILILDFNFYRSAFKFFKMLPSILKYKKSLRGLIQTQKVIFDLKKQLEIKMTSRSV